MCGRYSLLASIAELEGRFGFDGADVAYSSSYNVAPTQSVLTVVAENEAVRMRWGLIPSWAREASIGSRMNISYAERTGRVVEKVRRIPLQLYRETS